MNRNHYENPPLIEAICDFKLENNDSWDWTIPGIFYSHIKDRFPEKREVKEIGIEFSLNKKIEPAFSKYPELVVDRLQFWNKENDKVVQVGENRLIINKRKPYQGWEKFKNFIIEIVEDYTKIVKETRVVSFSLRYINRIENLPSKFSVEKYFLIYPKFPRNLEVAIVPVNIQGNFMVDFGNNTKSTINLKFYNQEGGKKETKEAVWILDITINVLLDNPSTFDQTNDLLSIAHDHIIDTFESSITDELRKLFKEE